MRKNNDLAAWRLFFRVVDLGSISKAANEAGVEPSSVSRRITQLEAQVGVQLLVRSSRALYLTHAGQQAYERIESLIHELDSVTEDLSSEKIQLSGLIRLSAPVSFGDHDILVNWLTQFQQTHPQVVIELLLSNAFIDLREQGVDLAIRVGSLMNDRLIARPLGQLNSIMCASPEYVRQHGIPRHPNELLHHRKLIYTGRMVQDKISLYHEQEVFDLIPDGVLRINHLNAIHRATLAGAGIHIVAPRWHCTEDLVSGRLIQVLPDWHLPSSDVFLVRQPIRHTPQRVRALHDFLVEQWTQWAATTEI